MKLVEEDEKHYLEVESIADVLKIIAVAIIGAVGFVLLWVFIDLLK